MQTVYLDSQDFSHFSTKHKDHAKYESLKAELLQLKHSGEVRFVFSDVHIYEVFPNNASANAEGLDRIRTIAEFCGNESVPSFVSSIEHEVRSYIAKSQGIEPPPLSNNWFPDLDIASKPLERSTTRPNRQEWRSMESTLRKKNSPLTAEFRQKYPFIKDHSLFIRYYGHRAEWPEVVAMIERSMQDIKRFSTWIASTGDANLNIPDILRNGYTEYVNAITAIRDEVQLRASSISSKVEKQGLLKEISSDLNNSLLELQSSIARRLIPELESYPGTLTVNGSMPSLDVLLRYLAELIRRSAQLSTPRKPVGSDLADALHVSYLPKVDLFRTDAAAADALAAAHPERKADVVSDVFKLPALIKSKNSAGVR